MLSNSIKNSGITTNTSYQIVFKLTTFGKLENLTVDIRYGSYLWRDISGTTTIFAGAELPSKVISQKKDKNGADVYTLAVNVTTPASFGSADYKNIMMSIYGAECWIDDIEISRISYVKFENSGYPDIFGRVGYSFQMPAEPMRKGYVFTGWYADAACTTAYQGNKFEDTNTTIYAGWKKVETETEMKFVLAPPSSADMTVFKHNLLGGNIYREANVPGTAYLKLFKGDEPIQISPANYYPITFDYKSSDFNGEIIFGIASASKDDFNVLNNVLVQKTVSTSENWKTISLVATPETLSADGQKGDYIYFFVKVNSGGNGKVYVDNIVLKQETTIRFVTNGGGTIDDLKGEPGEAVTLPVPTNGTKTFSGWYFDKELKTKVQKAKFPTTVDVQVLYAAWDKEDEPQDNENFENYPNTLITDSPNKRSKEVFEISIPKLLPSFQLRNRHLNLPEIPARPKTE